MRAIIGKAGKSRVLHNEMSRYKKEEVLVIDAVGVAGFQSLDVPTLRPKSYGELISIFNELEQNQEFEHIKHIYLELNTRIEKVDMLLNWEKKLSRSFTVTIQDNEMDRILMVDMSLPFD